MNKLLHIVDCQHEKNPAVLEAILNQVAMESERQDKQMVDKETLWLLFGIKNGVSSQKEDFTADQLERKHQYEESLLRWLIKSAQFWINQSLLNAQNGDMIEHYWLLVKSFYVKDHLSLPIFDAQIFISLMNEISAKFTRHGQISCCQDHKESAMLLNYKAKRAKQDDPEQAKQIVEHNVAKYLAPIANLLETILSNKIKLLLIS